MSEDAMPCAIRMDHGGWCVLPDKHEGPHEGPARRYGPEDSVWHRHRGQMKPPELCLKATVSAGSMLRYTAPELLPKGAWCTKIKGHKGTCE